MLVEPEYPALVELGLITITGGRPGVWPNFEGTEISLTPEGTHAANNWKREEQRSTTLWTVPIASRQLRDVTGIRTIDRYKSEVEFTWAWMPNLYGEAVSRAVDRVTALKDEAFRRDELEYKRKMRAAQVDRRLQMLIDSERASYRVLYERIYAAVVNGKKLDKSKVFTAIVEFDQYDDGWRPGPNQGDTLRAALEKSEHGK